MDSVLRPRDIQARIRSGESPEAVATAAQTTVDKIMGFATPVLAERAYVAQQAQKASVRRRAADGPVAHLGEAVSQRLASSDVDPEAVEWDAWRREDGRWTLVADFTTARGGRRAQFVYDMAGRYVVADDDESRWLVGERVARDEAPASSGTPLQVTAPVVGREPAAAAPGKVDADDITPQRRLTPVPDEQLPIGDDAIEVVTGRRPGADWMSTQATDRPVVHEPADALFDEAQLTRPHEPARLVDPAEPAESVEPAEPAESVTRAEPDQPDQPDQPAEADEPTQPAKPAKSAKSTRARGRASVPSWDEIMFGSDQRD